MNSVKRSTTSWVIFPDYTLNMWEKYSRWAGQSESAKIPTTSPEADLKLCYFLRNAEFSLVDQAFPDGWFASLRRAEEPIASMSSKTPPTVPGPPSTLASTTLWGQYMRAQAKVTNELRQKVVCVCVCLSLLATSVFQQMLVFGTSGFTHSFLLRDLDSETNAEFPSFGPLPKFLRWWNPEPGTQSKSPTWVVGTQTLKPSLLLYPMMPYVSRKPDSGVELL